MTAAKNKTKPKKSTPTQDGPRPATGAEMLGRSRVIGVATIKIAAGPKFGEVDDLDLYRELDRSIDAIQSGDMRPVETMLFMQAKALETLFTALLNRGLAQDMLPQYQAHMALALRTQAQCRATLQTLLEAKQPRAVAFVKQANIAHQQQVNNGAPVAHARETAKPANELLEDATHEQKQRMVPRASAAPARGDPAMETVGAVHRAED